MIEKIVVFTDLDGTLLDHNTYQFDAAIPALTALKQRGIPVIPNTSKTRAEVVMLCESLGLAPLFIVENGSAVYTPEGFFGKKPEGVVLHNGLREYALAPPREKWLDLLCVLKNTFYQEFTHFEEMGTAGIVSATGLSWEEAKRAEQRDFTEPVLWLGSESRQGEFIRLCEEAGARVLHGGRFMHLAGACDKGTALRWFVDHYSACQTGEIRDTVNQIHSIGLGDSLNDLDMLNVVNQAVVVRGMNSDLLINKVGNCQVIYTNKWGPQGWNEAMMGLLLLL